MPVKNRQVYVIRKLVNKTVPFQLFAAMELGRSDREPEHLVTPCVCPCGDLCLRLGKVNGPPETLSALFGAIWQEQEQPSICWQGV